ncbi:hypothetical protein RJ640_025750 [Escallonia rubra]|uniref:Non-specific phospholipase C3 n=1 Tax=Escallonia rubra TaxID=112253 RepID=A0AA88R1N8_9ASTE|nr:hypothetical protein RJ640_025750 [Escallonia rubra]
MASNSNTTYPIKTVVVLVQENRSFDHMLGWMKSLNPEINGVTGTESNPISTSSPNTNLIHFGDRSAYVAADPGHSIQAIYEQVFGVPWSQDVSSKQLKPTMQGFAQNAEGIEKGMSEVVMNGFTPDAVPIYKELVAEFAVCDRWFAAIPASTQPNRLYVHSATSHGATSGNTKQLIEGFPQKTIFESLDEAANDDHPSHDVFEGQKFVKEVYEALRSSPQWNEMLFVIIYDEHGGFYDHVPTPVTGVPSPDGITGPEPYNFQFDRLGVRVPVIMISPWIERGTGKITNDLEFCVLVVKKNQIYVTVITDDDDNAVLHGPSGPHPTSEFEHSSIAATVKKIFNLKEFLTKRDAWAETLPEPVKLREAEAKDNEKLSEFQEELVQMAATLCGDHRKDTYPDKLVENMTVSDGVDYVKKAFKIFSDECERARQSGADESSICVPEDTPVAAEFRSFASKFFSCLVCDH